MTIDDMFEPVDPDAAAAGPLQQSRTPRRLRVASAQLGGCGVVGGVASSWASQVPRIETNATSNTTFMGASW